MEENEIESRQKSFAGKNLRMQQNTSRTDLIKKRSDAVY